MHITGYYDLLILLWEEKQAYDFSFHFGNWQLSERLLFNANFSVISWREQVNFQWDDDEVRIVLDQQAEFCMKGHSALNLSMWHSVSKNINF
jgi:hypothetical protein